ncbi:MAG TPA: sigma-54 dependent transcriptional regulator [Gemmatimonadota bacterium]|nr:sigma-54 dependent transcriptional regulator [Gemmatimonadota bacterium]
MASASKSKKSKKKSRKADASGDAASKSNGGPVSSAPVLVVDDEKSIVEALEAVLAADGYTVETARDGESAWEKLNDTAYGLVIVDLKLPDVDGLEIVGRIREEGLGSEVIIITGEASVDSAVEAMRIGAYDYLTKPLETDRLKALVPKALEKYDVREQKAALERKVADLTRYAEIVGQSEGMKEIYKTIEAVAPTDASVLIYGESGTGKELVAHALHDKSGRSDGPFVAVNCAAFPKDILENELFGHEKGAFTGSLKEKAGCFELADGGTLFLDEVAEMGPDTQVKLLRAIETQRFRRLGGKEEIEVDIRVLAATNRDVHEALREGDFREDLYYRLSVVEIGIPPLRERGSDIELLAQEFLEEFGEEHGKEIDGFSEDALKFLRAYDWPGNVRELKNAVERAVIMTGEGEITLAALRPRGADHRGPSEVKIPIGSSLEKAKARVILDTFASTGGSRVKTAAILGMDEDELGDRLVDLLGPKEEEGAGKVG